MRAIRERKGGTVPGARLRPRPQPQPRRAVAGRRGEPAAGPAATQRAAGAASRRVGAGRRGAGEARRAADGGRAAVRCGWPLQSNQPDATNSFVVCFFVQRA